jgi:hypothetical protein
MLRILQYILQKLPCFPMLLNMLLKLGAEALYSTCARYPVFPSAAVLSGKAEKDRERQQETERERQQETEREREERERIARKGKGRETGQTKTRQKSDRSGVQESRFAYRTLTCRGVTILVLVVRHMRRRMHVFCFGCTTYQLWQKCPSCWTRLCSSWIGYAPMHSSLPVHTLSVNTYKDTLRECVPL